METSLFHFLKKDFLKYSNKTLLSFLFICFFSVYEAIGQNDCIQSYAEITVDTLNGVYGFTLNGIDEDDRSGPVSSAGDINNDGFDDVIIGTRRANSTAGECYIVYGGTTFPDPIDLSTLDGNNGFTIYGLDIYDRLGTSVNSAGDVNNDGIDDLIIGATGAELIPGIDTGASYIIFGQNNFNHPFDLNTLDGSNGFVIYGMADNDIFGFTVAGAGDFNNDGYDDLIIGAYAADPNGNSYAGENYVVFGGSTISSPFDSNILNGSNGFIVNGLSAGDYFGRSVSGAGDMNNDGYDDVIIGAHHALNDAGQSYVIYGGTNFNSHFDLNSLNGSNGFIINGIDSNDASGWPISCAGDVNNDGFDDVIIGARNGDLNGQSYVVYGGPNISSPLDLNTLNGNNGFTINGSQISENLGAAVSNAGDINNDGFDDVIIGAGAADANGNGAVGQSYVIFGGSNISSSLNVTSLNGSNGFIINGIDYADGLGGYVSNAGDINSDGFDDVIISAPNADPNGIDFAGETYVLYGTCNCNIEASILNLPGSTFTTTPISLTAEPPGGQFTGDGVIFNGFNPIIAGPGFHTITYNYTDGRGCEAETSSTILVGTITYNFVNNNLGTIAP